MKRLGLWMMFALSVLLSACGGGDGGSIPFGTIALSTDSLEFAATPSGPAPSSQAITVHVTVSGARGEGGGLGVGYAGSAAPWLSFNVSGSGSQYVVTFSITETAYASGTALATDIAISSEVDGRPADVQYAHIAYTVADPSANPASGESLTIR